MRIAAAARDITLVLLSRNAERYGKDLFSREEWIGERRA